MSLKRRPELERSYDLIVIGHGIVGLAHALAAARAGHRVAVLDRDAQPNGASIRNFGFVTVTGQGWPHTWRRARRARAVWAGVAEEAGIPVLQRGLLMAARRPEALAVIEEFAAGPMGEGCRILRPDEMPAPLAPGLMGALVVGLGVHAVNVRVSAANRPRRVGSMRIGSRPPSSSSTSKTKRLTVMI